MDELPHQQRATAAAAAHQMQSALQQRSKEEPAAALKLHLRSWCKVIRRHISIRAGE